MRTLSIIAAAILGAALAAPGMVPAAAQGTARPPFWVGPPPAPGLHPGGSGGAVKGRVHRRGHAGERRIRPDWPHPRPRPRRWQWQWRYPPYYYFGPGYDYYGYDDDYGADGGGDGGDGGGGETAAVPPAEPATPPQAVPGEEPPPGPPDPLGAPRFLPARGAAPAEPLYEVGEPLPPDVPHVTLDWRHYRLPEPPPGRIYVRVGRAVLLIEAASRVVERRVIERPETERPQTERPLNERPLNERGEEPDAAAG
jgi:hypothetical protein